MKVSQSPNSKRAQWTRHIHGLAHFREWARGRHNVPLKGFKVRMPLKDFKLMGQRHDY